MHAQEGDPFSPCGGCSQCGEPEPAEKPETCDQCGADIDDSTGYCECPRCDCGRKFRNVRERQDHERSCRLYPPEFDKYERDGR